MLPEAGQSEAEPISARTRCGFVGAAVLALAWLMPLPAAGVSISTTDTAQYILVDTSTGISEELSHAASTIPTFVGDHSLLLDFEGGLWETDYLTINLQPGITVVDFNTHGNDLKLENDLFIDGEADAFAIFRIPDEANFLVSNSDMVVGDNSEIGLNNVLFYSDKPGTDQHFNFSNAMINGIAFWNLGMDGGEVAFSNVQGCTQVVAHKISLSNVGLTNCAFVYANSAPVPEPTSMLLFAVGSLVVGGALRKKA